MNLIMTKGVALCFFSLASGFYPVLFTCRIRVLPCAFTCRTFSAVKMAFEFLSFFQHSPFFLTSPF
jgi:hypothetical protein